MMKGFWRTALEVVERRAILKKPNSLCAKSWQVDVDWSANAQVMFDDSHSGKV